MTINAGSGGQDTEAQKVAPPDMPAFSENTSYILSSKNEVQSLEQDQSAGPDVKSIQNKVKRRKKKVEVACVYCRRSHMICDNVRPCSRCIKRGIGYLCHDEPATRQRKKGKPDILEKSLTVPDFHVTTSGIEVKTETPLAAQPVVSDFPSNFQPPSGIIDEKEKYQAQTQARSSGLNMSLPFNQEPYFYSEHAGSEFSSLNDFLSIIDDPELVNGALNDDHTTNDSMLPFSMHSDGASSSTNFSSLLQFSSASTVMSAFPDPGMNGQARQEPQVLPQNNNHLLDPEPIDKSAKVSKVSQTVSQKDPQMVPQGTSQIVSQNVPPKLKPGDSSNVLPVISDSARDKFFLTAADPTTEISPEERLKQVIKAKLEAGLLQPYNYAKGYARLQRYMDNYMNHTSRQRILKPLSIFRPAFRAIAKTLKDVDLVLVEESFERMLLDYDRVFTSMAIPACLWRRTGEIYRGNKEFASLVGVTTDDLKDGKLAIYELMSEESAVNFWEKYGAIAFDKGQKAVLTSCNLRNKDGRKRKSCCFSFTIRRDRYSIPSCIVGNFIPIDP